MQKALQYIKSGKLLHAGLVKTLVLQPFKQEGVIF
jgi:hypothetical protein